MVSTATSLVRNIYHHLLLIPAEKIFSDITSIHDSSAYSDDNSSVDTSVDSSSSTSTSSLPFTRSRGANPIKRLCTSSIYSDDTSDSTNDSTYDSECSPIPVPPVVPLIRSFNSLDFFSMEMGRGATAFSASNSNYADADDGVDSLSLSCEDRWLPVIMSNAEEVALMDDLLEF